MAIKKIFRISSLMIVMLSLLSTIPAQAQSTSAKSKALLSTTNLYKQQTYLKASDTIEYSNFGQSIAISGNRVVVGTDTANVNAAVYVFVSNEGTWSQEAILKPSDVGGVSGSAYFGSVVAISGDTIAVAAPFEGSIFDHPASGAVYIFTRNGSVWSLQASLKASNPDWDDHFGTSVALSGDTLIVGAPGEGSNATGINGDETNNLAPNSGAVYVFNRNGNIWSQSAYIKASNTGESDMFGKSVAISGDTVVVGAFQEQSNATGINGDQTNNSSDGAGAAYIFTVSGSAWTQQAYIKAPTTGSHHFGESVAISGNTLVASESGDISLPPSPGAAHIFKRTGTTWSQEALLKSSSNDQEAVFGKFVAIDGNTVLVSAPFEGSQKTGATYVFTDNAGTWSEIAHLTASNADVEDFFGLSIAISGDLIGVGAVGEASNATGVNGDQNNNEMDDSGAAYLFAPPSVISSHRAGAGLTNATTIDFNVGFSESMTGVDTSDFTLNTTGNIMGAQVTNVSGGPANYVVTVSTGTGDGTIRLDVIDDDTIMNADSIPLGKVGLGNGDFTSGESYTIDKTAPTILLINRREPNPTNELSVNFDITFSEAVVNMDTIHFSLTTTGVSGASIIGVNGSGATQTVHVGTGSGSDGTIHLNMLSNSTVTDLAGNTVSGLPYTTGPTFTVDKKQTLVSLSNPTQDGWVLESDENSNKGGTLNTGATLFYVGDDASKKQYRAILSFSTGASLPDAAIITQVKLKIRKYTIVGGGNPLSIFQGFVVDIKTGFFDTQGLRPSDFEATSSKTYGPFNSTPINNWYSLNLTPAKAYINKFNTNAGLTQIRLRFKLGDNNNAIANYLTLFSGEAGTVNRPQLVITYYVP